MEKHQFEHLTSKSAMKNHILSFVYLFFAILIPLCCISAKSEPVPGINSSGTVYNCELNGNLSPDERRNISLFRIAKQVKVVSFSQKVVTRVPIDHNQVVSKYLKDEITLTEDQIDQLTNILYNYNYSKNQPISFRDGCCYYPRHAILFLNSSGKVFGYFEFCFECGSRETFPYGENAGQFCPGKYELIKQLFQSVGVTFFKEES